MPSFFVARKPPFKSVGKIIEYLGRYTHHVAISNSHLLQIQDSKISFSWRNYHGHSKKEIMTISVSEFIRCFMLHTLPPPLIRSEKCLDKTFDRYPCCGIDRLARAPPNSSTA